MSGIYLKLNELADSISKEIAEKLSEVKNTINIICIIIGSNPASLSYINGMKNRASKFGISLDINQLDININEESFLARIKEINQDKKYTGVIIQMPLPDQIDFHKIALTLDHKKDLDCITPYNQGLLFCGEPFIIPATASAVDITLKYIEQKFSLNLTGKHAIIIGRSLTVGKPVYHLLLKQNITPTTVHTKTIDTETITQDADIIIASCGVPELITGKWIKKDTVVIDVGIHSIDCDNEKGFRLCGDTKSDHVLEKASILTAVPGGIGSITSLLVFANAIKCWYKINENKEIKFNFE